MQKIPDERLLARYLSDECSKEEKEIINDWLRENPFNRTIINQMKRIWASEEPLDFGLDLEKSWDRIEEKISKKPISKHLRSLQRKPSVTSRIMGVAAILLLAFTFSYLYSNITFETEQVPHAVELNKLIVKNSKRANLTLAEGTKIFLDAGSKISYPQTFEGEYREVFMSGEGIFDVSPDPEKPFIIHSNNAIIKVLGTKFNVRAWELSRKVEVAVAEGEVTLGLTLSDIDSVNETVSILNGQYSILHERGKPSKPLNVDIENYFSWQNREMTFDKSPLYEVLDQLERWYNLQFQLPDPSYASYIITIKIEPKPVNDIIQVIALIMNLDFERTGRIVIFSPKNKSKTVSLYNALTKIGEIQ